MRRGQLITNIDVFSCHLNCLSQLRRAGRQVGGICATDGLKRATKCRRYVLAQPQPEMSRAAWHHVALTADDRSQCHVLQLLQNSATGVHHANDQLLNKSSQPI